MTMTKIARATLPGASIAQVEFIKFRAYEQIGTEYTVYTTEQKASEPLMRDC